MKNLSLLTDFYELTMIQGYFYNARDKKVVFDYFVRKNPFEGQYMVFAGLQPLLEKLEDLKFDDAAIEYLRTTRLFREDFLQYLKDFTFSCDISSVKEGEIIFPNEPLVTVFGSIIEAQLIESMLLNELNFQTLVATKTARIVECAKAKSVLEFGLRRAQGIDGSLSATRASYIGGCNATSNTLAGKIFDIPVRGTMAHSWVMAFESEIEAFEKYAELYPASTVLLVDTYNTRESGIPNAIKVLKKLKSKGYQNFGIRLDSGNLDELCIESRKMLDDADLSEANIFISNELDEFIIDKFETKEIPVDAYGVGTKLVTGHPDSSLSGVYKLSEIISENDQKPVIKISDNIEKRTNPGVKNVMRFYNERGLMEADMLYLESEEAEVLKKTESGREMKILHQNSIDTVYWLRDYKYAEKLLNPVMKKGKSVIGDTDLKAAKKHKNKQLQKLASQHKKIIEPTVYITGLSQKLYDLKSKMIDGVKKL